MDLTRNDPKRPKPLFDLISASSGPHTEQSSQLSLNPNNVEGSFDDLLERAGIKEFRFYDLRHTFASWYMMNGGDLYELAKILGHSNIKMTERYAKLAKQHIARTSNTAREMWKLLEPISKKEAVG